MDSCTNCKGNLKEYYQIGFKTYCSLICYDEYLKEQWNKVTDKKEVKVKKNGKKKSKK